jgi:16S rRNA (cytidine1402-2'-O)-methyltransferase
MSGMAARRFCFEGFLPSDKKEHKRILSQLVREERTIILYEAPHRLKTTLEELRDTLGGSRRITLCRELTKRYEEAIPLTLDSALSYYEENEPRGEYVLILAGADPAALAEQDHRSWDTVPLEEHMEIYLSKGMTRKEAMKKVAADRGLSRRDIYRALLQEENW